ncbi:hypothetical protein GOBAR_AA14843 [Gossypium barbadense]|uniref:Uncharacterized protein n=1 Tax=Gossypium barbadense TaxID=3634 RepID=A0A2P5XRA2_GOSBA|nr:hypothetical protein GOBAR_AA14843 [Gossypium barbadense]
MTESALPCSIFFPSLPLLPVKDWLAYSTSGNPCSTTLMGNLELPTSRKIRSSTFSGFMMLTSFGILAKQLALLGFLPSAIKSPHTPVILLKDLLPTKLGHVRE